jgi:hypothetical protein
MLPDHPVNDSKTEAMNIARWLLFLPAAFAFGILFVLINVSIAATSHDNDLIGIIVLLAPVFGGGASIYVAINIAPSHPKSVAVITGIVCLLAVGVLFYSERKDSSIFAHIEMPAVLYCFGAALGIFVAMIKK